MNSKHRSFFIASLIFFIPATFFGQGISGTWSAAASEGFTPRADLTSCVVNGKIYAIGGWDSIGVLNTLEVYDPSTNTWSTPQTTGTFTARAYLSSCVVGDKIYVIGGND